jgi:hypothetical protein
LQNDLREFIMSVREEYVAVALLIFVLGLLASLMIPREYVGPMAVVVALIPIGVLLRSGVAYMIYLFHRQRYMRGIR